MKQEVGLTIIDTIIGFDLDDGWYSFYCRDCYKKVTKNDDIDAGPFHCDDCGFVSDVFGKIRIVVRVQDESGSSSFVLFERHVKDLIRRGNQWLMEKIAKDQGRQQIRDEFKILLNKKVLAEVFKWSPNHQHHTINDNDTPINKPNKENTNSVHDDNLDVVELEVVTPSSSTGKRLIEIDANSDSLEWSSSKTRIVHMLPSSVYPVSDEAVTSGGVVYFLLSNEAVTSGGVIYFLLSNDTILRFDIYSEEHILIFSPSIINDFRPYASRLIKFHGKLGYFSVSGDHLWAICVFIQNRWIKVDVSNYNECAHEWWDYRNSTLYFFNGNTIEYVVLAHPSQQVFSIRSDIHKLTIPSRY
ncbi:unnamed protein product [Lactuca saligna]|uniref:Replication factor A C-terminal domain-containing protein n=1 Tax=Lactuca saligna TaxID=75948 RepID=A0AA36EC10_LACSI|nr:unnamed protein product [Lactuca saligna]